MLCSLLLHLVVGFPHARQALAKSARGDDLISGSDFLSVFIGANVPRPRPAIRRRTDSVASEESAERYTEAEFDSRVDTYPTPNDSQNPEQESPEDSSTSSELENSYADSNQDYGNKELSSVSTNLANDLDSINNAGPQKSSKVNNDFIQDVDVEPIGESSITSSRRIEYLSDIRKVDEQLDSKEKSQTSTLAPSQSSPSNARNYSAPTLGIQSVPSTFFINSETPSVDENYDSIFSNENTKDANLDNSDSKEEFIEKFTTELSELVTGTDHFEAATENPQNETHQIISVRVSSSVARSSSQYGNKNDNDNKENSNKPNEDKQDIFSTFIDAFSASAEEKEISPSLEGISLVTEEQPAATSIQRSQLSVEESSPSSSVISVRQEVSSSNVQSRNAGTSIESPQSSAVSYHTSVSTATSGSRVQFYSEPSGYQRVSSSAAETVQNPVVAQHTQGHQHESLYKQTQTIGVGGNQQNSNSNYDQHQQSGYLASNPVKNRGFNSENEQVYQSDNSRTHKSYEPQERNYEEPEHRYGTPERSYAKPEQNYEVDESVSVNSNGRAHGVQYQSVTTPGHGDDTGLRDFSTQPGETRDPNSKFGYVVEGRNFRKYRVEERTPDGFIVGEYGVVSHDDGSLRGVRYTADGTINPRLIYDALVKFLSL